mmetsp:Transcript_93809/g.265325  ORF Transcript_93809/g.265325 Transcript_93809/m.265325 type:complete len:394 (-) Transcript_93809:90-1271(-)
MRRPAGTSATARASLALGFWASRAAAEEATCSVGRKRPVHAAFYLWYGNPESDGRWLHWDHKVLPHWDPKVDAQHPKFNWRPPDEHHSPFRPQRGLFSARSNETLREQFAELAVAGVDSAMISWWGRKDWTGKRDDADSGANTDELVPAVLEAALRAGVFVSFHIEPYGGRTPDTFLEDLRYIHKEYGHHAAVWREGERALPVFWLYDVSAQHSHQDVQAWRRVLDSVRGTALDGVFLCLWIGERGDAQFVEEGGFDGAYTYFAALGFTPGSNPRNWPSIKRALDKRGKLFVPAVGPGYDDTLVRPWNAHNVRDRRQGGYYDGMWESAVDLQPHAVSVTSYNEWGEGTQIEPAQPYTSPQGRRYQDYLPEGPDFYLRRTAHWAGEFRNKACKE